MKITEFIVESALTGSDDHEIVNELFKNTVPWKWAFRGSEEATAYFTVGEVPYRFYAHLMNLRPNTWDVEFSVDDDSIRDADKEYSITGSGNAATVMSVVTDIIKAFLDEYTGKVDILNFTAVEESRKGLYARMVQRLLPDWSMMQFGNTFIVKSPEIVATQTKGNRLKKAQALPRPTAAVVSEDDGYDRYKNPYSPV